MYQNAVIKKWTGGVCVLILIGMLWALLRPFGVSPENDVRWLEGGGGCSSAEGLSSALL